MDSAPVGLVSAFRPAAATRRAHLSIAAGLCLAAAPLARAEEVVRVSGTGTVLGAAARLAEAFERSTPGVRLKVLSSLGSSGAIQAVAVGALELAISGRPLEPEEQALGLIAHELARTPFVFAVGPRVPERGLTGAEIVAIYRGEKTRWSNGERIRLVLRPLGDADTILLKGISPEMDAAVDAANERPGLPMAVTNQECNEAIARTPGGIGPTSLMQLLGEGATMPALSLDGVAPTVANMAAGRYRLVKSLYLVTRASSGASTRRFLAFVASEGGRRILEDTGALAIPFRLD